jgi:hypothetical protein
MQLPVSPQPSTKRLFRQSDSPVWLRSIVLEEAEDNNIVGKGVVIFDETTDGRREAQPQRNQQSSKQTRMAVIFAISRDWGCMPVRLPLSRPHIPALI